MWWDTAAGKRGTAAAKRVVSRVHGEWSKRSDRCECEVENSGQGERGGRSGAD